MSRNISIEKHFEHLASKHRPRFRFEGSSKNDWQAWCEQLYPKAIASLGSMPDRVPLRPEILKEWREEGLIKQKIIFDVEEGLSATALIFRPETTSETASKTMPSQRPAILCCHGHGVFGKDFVMGDRSSPELVAGIALHNYDYGLQMAKAGFVTMAIDWRGFGERDDRRATPSHDVVCGRDICNVHYIRENILGRTLLGMNVHDARCALDILCDQDDVDSEKIGVMGLSFGGTMTAWISIVDPRIKAADIICYSDRFADFAMRDANFCGSQITTGLYELCDLPDLQGLIAPRPLLVEIGKADECFKFDSALSCFHEVEKIYDAAGVRDRLDLDLFDGGHAWGAGKSVEFFQRQLNKK